MKLCERLKSLRKKIGISQEAIGSQGFVSVPGWMKLENGQRTPSDKLIMRLVGWMLRDEYANVSQAARILEELLTLKYLNSQSAFLRRLASVRAKTLFGTANLRLADDPAVYRPKRQQKATRAQKN